MLTAKDDANLKKRTRAMLRLIRQLRFTSNPIIRRRDLIIFSNFWLLWAAPTSPFPHPLPVPFFNKIYFFTLFLFLTFDERAASGKHLRENCEKNTFLFVRLLSFYGWGKGD